MSPTPRRRLWRWLTDWRNGLTFIASCVLALFAVFILDSINARNDAQDQAKAAVAESRAAVAAAQSATEAQRSSADRASRRITQLQSEIARNRGDIDALREQLVGLGATPTVPIRTDIAPLTPPAATPPATAPSPTPPTPATPPAAPPSTSTPPTTTRPCRVSIPGRCVLP